MKVHDIMTPGALCVGPDTSVAEAAAMMRQLNVGVLPVCDQERLTGVITDRDITTRAVAADLQPRQTRVQQVMSPGVTFVYEDQPVEAAALLMEQRQIRRLPVLNGQRRLVGMVSLGDIALESDSELAGGTLREISQPPGAMPRSQQP